MRKIISFIIVILTSLIVLGNGNVVNATNIDKITVDLVSDQGNNTNYSYYNDSTLYQVDQYATYYYKNLTENFGNNLKGSCTYVAFAMLLSYYDTYWDDSIIPENYDMITMLSANELGLNVESPGIYKEISPVVWNNISTTEYYQAVEQYSNAYFHLKLIQMGKEKFGQYEFDDASTPCGLFYSELIQLIKYYLYDYMNFDSSKISYTSTDTNVRQFAIDNIQAGNPVLIRMGSSTDSEAGHSFVLYDYDEINDELYGHLGWHLPNGRYAHVKLSTTPYDVFWDATVLNVNTTHSCSNNYKYSDGYEILETYCPCKHGIHEAHIHSYVYESSVEGHSATCVDCGHVISNLNNHDYDYDYDWISYTQHSAECICGETTIQPHVVSSGSYNTGQRYASCLFCGGLAEIGFVDWPFSLTLINKVTINGSFILPNGIIVLEDKDIETYLNGTLFFYDKNNLPVIK